MVVAFYANELLVLTFLRYLQERYIDYELDQLIFCGYSVYQAVLKTINRYPLFCNINNTNNINYNILTIPTKILVLLNIFYLFLDYSYVSNEQINSFVYNITYIHFRDDHPGNENARRVSDEIDINYRFRGFYDMYIADPIQFLSNVLRSPIFHLAYRHRRLPEQIYISDTDTESLPEHEFEPDFEYDEPPVVPYIPHTEPPANINKTAFIQEAITQFEYTKTDMCTICRSGVGSECVMLFGCSHIFHGNCIEESMNSGFGNCPICRTKIKCTIHITLQ